MSLHINKFIDSMRAHEAKNTRVFSMPMPDAKSLLADITELLLELNQLKSSAAQGEQVIEVQLQGRRF